MPNRLIEKLRADFDTTTEQYEDILNRCADEGRDPNSVELRQLDEMRSILDPLSERLVELSETENRRYAAVRAMGDDPGEMRTLPPNSNHGPVEDTRSPEVQGRGGIPPLLFGDKQIREFMAAVENRSALTMGMEPIHNRATVTTPPASVIGTWPQPFSVTGREPRIAEMINGGVADGNLVQFLRVNQPAVSQIVPEGNPKPDSNLTIVRQQEQIQKWASWTDVTWEMVSDFSDAQQLINTEMLGSIVTAENTYIIGRILQTLPGGPVLVSASRIQAILELKQAVIGGSRGIEPNLVFLNPADVTTVLAELASTGELVAGPAVITDQLGMRIWGMRLVQQSNITLGQVLVGLSSDASFWVREGPQLFVDPYTSSKNNITTVIVEERGAAGVTRTSTWAVATLPNP